jgi:tetratricopeptide (TPR) repeat protein
MMLSIVLVLFASAAGACLQTYGTDLHAHRVSFNGLTGSVLVDMVVHFEPRVYWLAKADGLRAQIRTTSAFQKKNDYAVAIAHLGRVSETLAILRQIEHEHPGHYQTAANLGTALELSGDNAGALQWIREGIRRNPDDHLGTEWLHVRILEAKIAAARDPKWLLTHSVAGADFGPAALPHFGGAMPLDNGGHTVTLSRLKDALTYQLGERVEFTPAHDPFVADLLFDWGNLLALTEVVESADAAYDLAAKYGPPRSALFAQRRAFMKDVLRRAPKQ